MCRRCLCAGGLSESAANATAERAWTLVAAPPRTAHRLPTRLTPRRSFVPRAVVRATHASPVRLVGLPVPRWLVHGGTRASRHSRCGPSGHASRCCCRRCYDSEHHDVARAATHGPTHSRKLFARSGNPPVYGARHRRPHAPPRSRRPRGRVLLRLSRSAEPGAVAAGRNRPSGPYCSPSDDAGATDRNRTHSPHATPGTTGRGPRGRERD